MLKLGISRKAIAALLLFGAVLAVGSIVWRAQLARDTSPGLVQAVELGAPPPPSVYVLPSQNPKVSQLGTDASVSPDALRLQLFATAPGKTPREGTATLGTHPNNPQTYTAGALLASGASIEEIHGDYVVLMSAGELVKLFRVGFANPDDGALERATTVGGKTFADRPVETHANSREDFAELIRPTLMFDNEKLSGFRITAGSNSSALERLGLVAGDVIRSIDGRPVTADADWQKVANALSSGTALVLSVERADSLIPVMMDSKQLSTRSSVATGIALEQPPST